MHAHSLSQSLKTTTQRLKKKVLRACVLARVCPRLSACMYSHGLMLWNIPSLGHAILLQSHGLQTSVLVCTLKISLLENRVAFFPSVCLSVCLYVSICVLFFPCIENHHQLQARCLHPLFLVNMPVLNHFRVTSIHMHRQQANTRYIYKKKQIHAFICVYTDPDKKQLTTSARTAEALVAGLPVGGTRQDRRGH